MPLECRANITRISRTSSSPQKGTSCPLAVALIPQPAAPGSHFLSPCVRLFRTFHIQGSRASWALGTGFFLLACFPGSCMLWCGMTAYLRGGGIIPVHGGTTFGDLPPADGHWVFPHFGDGACSWLFFTGEQLREGGAIIIASAEEGCSPGRQRSRTRRRQLWAGAWAPLCLACLTSVLRAAALPGPSPGQSEGHLSRRASGALKAPETFPGRPLVSQGPHAGRRCGGGGGGQGGTWAPLERAGACSQTPLLLSAVS